jgi:hypothetical protein
MLDILSPQRLPACSAPGSELACAPHAEQLRRRIQLVRQSPKRRRHRSAGTSPIDRCLNHGSIGARGTNRTWFHHRLLASAALALPVAR